MKLYKKIIYILSLCFLFGCFTLVSYASGKDTAKLISDEKGRVVSVSHRGDTAQYPANSLKAIISADEKGADAVSVAVSKTKDGEFVLVEDISLGNICNSNLPTVGDITFSELNECRLYDSFGVLTEYKAASLEQALKELDGSVYLILDIQWENRDEIYKILEKCNAFGYTSLRAEASASEISAWADGKVSVIGIYGGNIIWNSIGHINKLSEAGMSMAEYRTKNYFNVCYGTLVGDKFSADGKARTVAAAYDPDLCGQKSDSSVGWNELIDDGFTVIETNNSESLVSYINESEKVRQSLSDLLSKAEKTDMAVYSSVSRDNLSDAINNASAVLDGRACSLEKAQEAYSELVFCLGEKRISDGKEDTKGALNITAGKIIAVVLVGSAILGAQIFIEKSRKKKA